MTINLLLQITNNKVENKPRIGEDMFMSCAFKPVVFPPDYEVYVESFPWGKALKWMSGTQIEGIWLKMKKQNRGKRMYRLLTGMILQVGGAQTRFAFLFVSCCEFLSFTFMWIPGSRGSQLRKKIVPFKPTAPPPVLGSAEKIGNSSGPSIFQQSAKAKGKIFPLKAVSSDTIESQPTSNGFSGLRRVKQTATIGLDFRRHWAPARGDGGGILRAPGFWGQPRTASFLRLVGLCMRLYECPKIQWHFNNNHAKDFQHPAIWRYHDWF